MLKKESLLQNKLRQVLQEASGGTVIRRDDRRLLGVPADLLVRPDVQVEGRDIDDPVLCCSGECVCLCLVYGKV